MDDTDYEILSCLFTQPSTPNPSPRFPSKPSSPLSWSSDSSFSLDDKSLLDDMDFKSKIAKIAIVGDASRKRSYESSSISYESLGHRRSKRHCRRCCLCGSVTTTVWSKMSDENLYGFLQHVYDETLAEKKIMEVIDLEAADTIVCDECSRRRVN